MARTLYNRLVTLFGSNNTSNTELLTWAKTEYGSDWKYAYESMLKNRKNFV